MNIGRYEVIRELGKGGMAIVHLAYDPYIKRHVAVKVLPSQFTHDPEFRQRFLREAQVIAALEHPYIVPIYDFGELDDQPFIVMRYLPGETLRDKLKKSALTVSEIVPLFQSVASAMDYAHRNGIIHRDIKPGNILFDSEGKAHLSDFGIAKIQEANAAFTGTGSLVGTPAYMSPEQAMGEKAIDSRADIYSLGVVLFQCLTGELPFKADTPMGLAIAHIQQPVPNLMSLRPDLPPGFDGIIHKALDKTPSGRYQTAGQISEAINDQAKFSETGAGTTRIARSEPLTTDSSTNAAQSYGKSAPAQSAVDSVSLPIPKSKRPGAMLLGGIFLLVLLIGTIGLVGGFVTGIIPNPLFAGVVAVETATVTPAKIPGVTASPTAKASATSTPSPTLTPTEASPTEAFSPTPDAPLPEFTDDKGVVMVLISAGEFLMGGKDLNAEPDEKPVHSVTLRDYYIDKYEVTNGAYKACVDDGTCTPPKQTDSFTRSKYYGIQQYNDYPVVYVDWDMAKNYCEWRGARLPTEAEWEKAARGSEDQRIYPWGDGKINCQLSNYNGSNGCYNGTTQAGSIEGGKSPYGVYDMAGNVWEWVTDWYSENYYKISLINNPVGPDTGQAHVLRGGSWNRSEFDVRVSNRNRFKSNYYNFDIGFRCAENVSR